MSVDFNPCESLHAYFFRELDEQRARIFERHLPTCSDCRAQLEELQWLWRELPLVGELYEPPVGLKAEVLRAAFGGEEEGGELAGNRAAGGAAAGEAADGRAGLRAAPVEAAEARVAGSKDVIRERGASEGTASGARAAGGVGGEGVAGEAGAEVPPAVRSFTYTERPPRWRGWRRGIVVSAAGLVLLLGGFAAGLAVGGGWPGRDGAQPAASAGPSAQQPWSLQREVALRAVSPAPAAGAGSVWLLRQNEATQVVLRVSGLPATQNGQSYQMWMVRSGKRWSCGTFQVDPSGNGALLYQMKSEAGFDSIGITLEPDASGKQPRGPKVLGS